MGLKLRGSINNLKKTTMNKYIKKVLILKNKHSKIRNVITNLKLVEMQRVEGDPTLVKVVLSINENGKTFEFVVFSNDYAKYYFNKNNRFKSFDIKLPIDKAK